MFTSYSLAGQAVGSDADVLINRIPVARFRAGRPVGSIPCGPVVVHGANQVSVAVRPGPSPSRAHEASTTAEPQTVSGIVAVKAWRKADDDWEALPDAVQVPWQGHGNLWPSLHAGSWTAEQAYPAWAWQRCAPIQPQMLADGRRFVAELADRLMAGDFGWVAEACRPALEDSAVYFDDDKASAVAAFKALLQQRFAGGPPALDLPPQAAWDLRLCGKDNVLDCVGSDWEPIIRARPTSDGQFLFSAKIGLLDGNWRIVLR